MKKFLMCLVLFLTIALVSQAQKSDYEVALEKMLKASHTMDMMKDMTPQVIAMIKQQAPDIPQDALDEMKKELDVMYGEIIKTMVPIYQKYLTIEDIKEITKFYETPIGKKLAEATPRMTAEAMQESLKISQQSMQRIMQKMVEKGYIKK